MEEVKLNPTKSIESTKIDEPKEIQKESVVEIIEEISEEIKKENEEKPWWTSKVILVNIGALIVMGTAYFGFDLKSHGINIQSIIEIASIMLPIVNIWFRSRSSNPTKPIKRVMMPATMKTSLSKSVTAVKSRLSSLL